MVRLYGSYNGRYFLAQLPGEARVYRGPAHQWTRPVAGVRETLAVGNNGEVFFRTDAGVIVRLPFDRQAELTKVDILRTKPEEQVRLGKLRINADGREFCYEKIVPEKRLSEKIFRLLGTKKNDEPSATNHTLNLLNPRSGEVLSFFSTIQTARQDDRFLWEVSPYFIYLVVGQSEKKGLVFQIVNIPDKAVTGEFEMQTADISRAWINDQGTVLLEVKRQEGNTLVIVGSMGKFLMTPPPNYRILHLGPDWVAFQTMVDPHIIVRRFDNSPITTADLRPLGKLGVEYRFLVNDRGDVDLLTFANDELTVQHTDFSNLETDAKRWDLLARQVVQQEENQAARQAIEAHQEKARRMAHEEKQRELMSDVRRSAPAPSSLPLELEGGAPVPARLSLDDEGPEIPLQPAGPIWIEPEKASEPTVEAAESAEPMSTADPSALSIDELTRELEKLQMHYIAGEIGREEYYRRKGELETARKTAQAAPARGSEPPKVLEITPVDKLSLPKTENEPPLLKGPRIDLGRVRRPDQGGDGSS